MSRKKGTVPVSVRVNRELWMRFKAMVIEKHSPNVHGAISEELNSLLKRYIKEHS